MRKRKLYISTDLGLNPEQAVLIGDFCNFCANHFPTTAAYHRGRNIIKVYGKNRALVDILRSIAHELTHLKQDERGELVGMIQDAGGEIEDEANAKAGEIIKLYAKSDPERRRIYESATKDFNLL